MDAAQIVSIIKDIFMKDRTIVCDDYDASLMYLKRDLNLEILEYPSGSVHWKWVIPDKYSVNEAYIQNLRTGEIVVDVARHPLHLAAYSAPFSGELSCQELLAKVSWRDDLPDAIPYFYKFQYRPWEKDWRFCMTKRQVEQLDRSDRYKVVIDTEKTPGTMKVARARKQGQSDKTILLVSHLDHPCQVNDGLSGVVVELALMLALKSMDTYYSYEMLIVPEFFGSVAYLSSLESPRPYVMGIFTEMLSTGLPLTIQKSYSGDTYIDRVSSLHFRQQLPSASIVDYLQAVGNDEIVFESPGFEIPFISVTRARSNGRMYPEYHTSLDNDDLLDEKQIDEALRHLLQLLLEIETDVYPKRTFDGFLCLSNPEIDLYFNKDDFENYGTQLDETATQSFHDFQFGGFRMLNGRHRVSEIAERYQLPFPTLHRYLAKMRDKGLVTFSMESADA